MVPSGPGLGLLEEEVLKEVLEEEDLVLEDIDMDDRCAKTKTLP